MFLKLKTRKLDLMVGNNKLEWYWCLFGYALMEKVMASDSHCLNIKSIWKGSTLMDENKNYILVQKIEQNLDEFLF